MGERFILPSGKRVYLARKGLKDIIHGGKSSLTEAVKEGVAAWSLDHDTIIRERANGVRYLGVKERESGTIWITPLAVFEDRALYKPLNFRSSRRIERCVNFRLFRRRVGVIRKL